jgi:hypothetical protein
LQDGVLEALFGSGCGFWWTRPLTQLSIYFCYITCAQVQPALYRDR